MLYIDSSGIYVISGILIFELIIFVGFIIIFIHQWRNSNHLNHSIAYYHVINAFGALLILKKHLLYQGILNILFSSFRCVYYDIDNFKVETGYPCKDEIQIVFVIISIIVILLTSIFAVIYLTLYSDEQLDSKLPWTHCSRVFDIVKYLLMCYFNCCSLQCCDI